MRSTGQTSAFAETFAGTFDIPLSYVERLQAASAAAHPMLEAAGPLLQASRTMPSDMDAQAIPAYRQWLLNEAKMFERVCDALKVPKTDANNARYCLCATLDEAAMQTRWGKGAAAGTEWNANGLATTLGYDRQGADRVFALIDSTMREPHAHADLLMVLQQIVESGFKGRHRRTEDGARKLRSIRKSLDKLVGAMQAVPHSARATAPPADEPIATAAPQDTAPVSSTGRSGKAPTRPGVSRHGFADVPFRMESAIPLASSGTTRRISWRKPWVLPPALVTALIIISAIFLCRLHDGWGAPPRTSSLTQIAQAIRSRLPQALASNAVSLRENDDHSRLAIRVDGMFAPGKYALNEASVPLVAQVGQAIAAGRANVLVHLTGYTDDTPFESAGLSNRTLSALRAQTVMQVLTNAGVSPERITVNGNGESSPLDDNHTREGRARNRRVEIVVEQWP